MVFQYIVNKNSWKFIYVYILHFVTERSSQQRWSIKRDAFIKNFAKFTGKHMCQSLCFNKVVSIALKKQTLVQVFSCEFCKIFKNSFLKNSVQLLLVECKYNNNTKMIRRNIKHNYALPHIIHFSQQMLLFIAVEVDIQKQPFADVLENKYS